MTDLTSLTLAEASSGLATKSFTALELTDAHLAAIEAARALNAFVLETPEQARAMARSADAEIAKGRGAARVGASSPLAPRSIRPDRSRARCVTLRSCCARWRAMTPRTPRRSTFRCRTTRRGSENP